MYNVNLYYEMHELDGLIEDVLQMNPDSEEFMKIIMKIVCSFGKERLLTNTGIAEGMRLFQSKEPLTRSELMTCVFVMTELSILEDFDETKTRKLKAMFNYMNDKYSPDDNYLKEYAQTHLMELGFVRVNPQYIPDIQKHFMVLLSTFPLDTEKF